MSTIFHIVNVVGGYGGVELSVFFLCHTNRLSWMVGGSLLVRRQLISD